MTIEQYFQQMMSASFGRNWEQELSEGQIADMRRAFFGGVVTADRVLATREMEWFEVRQELQQFADNGFV